MQSQMLSIVSVLQTIFSHEQNRVVLDAAAGPGQSILRAQLEALGQEMEAVKVRESVALVEVERFKQGKLEAEGQQQ
jgi:hypothetical protein